MSDLNLCQFIGRLGKDPETRYMQDGGAVANFSLACGWKTKSGEGTEWVRCVAFGKLAEVCEKYLSKGKQVYVSGRMRTRQWEKDGQKQYSTEVVLTDMQMLGRKDDDKPAKAPPVPAGDFEDDVPF